MSSRPDHINVFHNYSPGHCLFYSTSILIHYTLQHDSNPTLYRCIAVLASDNTRPRLPRRSHYNYRVSSRKGGHEVPLTPHLTYSHVGLSDVVCKANTVLPRNIAVPNQTESCERVQESRHSTSDSFYTHCTTHTTATVPTKWPTLAPTNSE